MSKPKKKKPNTDLIKCKHGWRPWSIVCVHLLNGSSTDWIPIPQNRKGDSFDWICPKCDKRWEEMVEKFNIDDVRPVCIDCVADIRRGLDRNFKLTI
jgi:hypothetical protein